MRIAVTSETLSPEHADALERGTILYFPRSPIALPSPEALAFLREELPGRLERKNVSYYPAADRLVGVSSAPERERAREILAAHSGRVRGFLEAQLPSLAKGLAVGTSSFRPLEEKGRNLSPHASNELIHVDAGAYGATHGDRILRFFINVHPTEDRIWATRGPFKPLFARYGTEAGVPVGPLRASPLGRSWSWFLRAASAIAPRAPMIDTSPYDRRMRRFHNFMKDTPAFQSCLDDRETYAFPPGSAWMVFTDTLSHACLSGQFALVDTFVVPLANCRIRESAPYYVLSGEADVRV